MENVKAQFDRIPELKGQQDIATIERLGGLTNLVYRIGLKDQSYILRMAGEGTQEYIDRKVEEHNARVAAEAGVSAKVQFFDSSDGLMLADFIEGDTMNPDKFASTPGSAKRAAFAFKKLHDSGFEFNFRFELFSMIDDYLKILNDLGAILPDGYHDVVKEAESVRKVLNDNPIALAPCHCDPLCENFIDDGERMWIVDWEYSGMNDPFWDLGDLSVEAGFTTEQDMEMMQAYVGGMPSEAEIGRMVIYKAMCDLLWTLWGLIQHANDNPVDDFWAYAVGRFERCKTLMSSDEFSKHLKAIGQ